MEIFTKYEKQIIELLLQNNRTLPEIATKLQISKPTTSKYLKKLEEKRIITGTYEKTSVGRTIRYQLNPLQIVISINPKAQIILNFKADTSLDQDFLLLGAISQKEFREEVKKYLKEIKKASCEKYLILLYGSIARGEGTRKSDIDLLFLKQNWLKTEKDELLGYLALASNQVNHQAKPLFKNTTEFEQMDNTLKKEIKQHGIIIYEKGNQWDKIKQQLTRYKSITI